MFDHGFMIDSNNIADFMFLRLFGFLFLRFGLAETVAFVKSYHLLCDVSVVGYWNAGTGDGGTVIVHILVEVGFLGHLVLMHVLKRRQMVHDIEGNGVEKSVLWHVRVVVP